MFTPLDEDEIKKIVQLQLKGVQQLLAENGLRLEFTDSAVNSIAEEGFDPQFGARPVKRVIQRYVLNPLSKDILARKVNQEKPIVVDSINNELVFNSL
jgi:ATP-dependent Clp protease ATP-binding subunit ClpB